MCVRTAGFVDGDCTWAWEENLVQLNFGKSEMCQRWTNFSGGPDLSATWLNFGHPHLSQPVAQLCATEAEL